MRAVDGVSLDVAQGETLGLVGESGCGKSTLCRTILQLLEPTSGSVRFDGREIVGLRGRRLQPLRRQMQMIFQDPYASLNPRKRVGDIVGDPLRLHGLASGQELKRQVQELLERVGLGPEHYGRFPHEFSGGQRQRIGIARALALRPKLIIADEPVSALDVSIQAQIINLLDELQDEFKLTYIFVAHDLGVIRHVSDRIAVMYLGKVVEIGPAEEVYSNPIHPYTLSLLASLPIPDPKANAAREPLVLAGDVPSPADPPAACRFHTRCPYATEICSEVEPQLVHYGNGHWAACHHPLDREHPEAVERGDAPSLTLDARDHPRLHRGGAARPGQVRRRGRPRSHRIAGARLRRPPAEGPMRISRPRGLGAACLAAIGALLVGITGCGDEGGGGTVIRGTTAQPVSYDPAGAYDLPSYNAIYNIYQGLLTIPPGGTEAEPEAARSCEFTNDTTYECTLEDGLRFSDGSPLTAEDVKFSFDRNIEMAHPKGASFLLANLERTEAPDPKTVIFHLKAPDVTFPLLITAASFAIVPSDVFPRDKLQPSGRGDRLWPLHPGLVRAGATDRVEGESRVHGRPPARERSGRGQVLPQVVRAQARLGAG